MSLVEKLRVELFFFGLGKSRGHFVLSKIDLDSKYDNADVFIKNRTVFKL